MRRLIVPAAIVFKQFALAFVLLHCEHGALEFLELLGRLRPLQWRSLFPLLNHFESSFRCDLALTQTAQWLMWRSPLVVTTAGLRFFGEKKIEISRPHCSHCFQQRKIFTANRHNERRWEFH
jgi:hypothetical protein